MLGMCHFTVSSGYAITCLGYSMGMGLAVSGRTILLSRAKRADTLCGGAFCGVDVMLGVVS